MQMSTKYAGKCSNWTIAKKKIAINCDPDGPKSNDIFFKGSATGSYKHQFRQHMQQMVQNRSPFQIYLDAWTNYEPMYKWCHHKYLLDLPGHYPWSTRIKYLLLMKSLVLNVNVRTFGVGFIEEPWVDFTSYFFRPGRDYIQFIYNYHHIPRNKPNEELRQKLK